jgi:hypothetical protein
MFEALRDYAAEYGWRGLITDKFSPTRGWLAERLCTLANRAQPNRYLDGYLRDRGLLPGPIPRLVQR